MKDICLKSGLVLVLVVSALSCQEQITVQNKPVCESLSIDKNIVGNWAYVSTATFQYGTKFTGKIRFESTGVVTDPDSLFGITIEGATVDTKNYFVKGDTINIKTTAKTRSILYKYLVTSTSCNQIEMVNIYNSQITLKLSR